MKIKRKPQPGCVLCKKYNPATKWLAVREDDGSITITGVCKPHRKGKKS